MTAPTNPSTAPAALHEWLRAERDPRHVPCAYADLWMDMHPDIIVDILWMHGDEQKRARIERSYRLPDRSERDTVSEKIADQWDASIQAPVTRKG